MAREYNEHKYQKDLEFLRIAQPLERTGRGIDDIFNDNYSVVETKVNALETKYRNLYIGQGSKIPIKDCSVERIGNAFKKEYHAATKRVKKYESTLGSLEEKVEEESQKDKEIKPGEQLTLF